jgi:hypothetical protein
MRPLEEGQRSRWLVRKSTLLTSELRQPAPRCYAVVFNLQSALYLATLSIGPYLLLEGPVPTKRLYPMARSLNAFGVACSKCLSLNS